MKPCIQPEALAAVASLPYASVSPTDAGAIGILVLRCGAAPKAPAMIQMAATVTAPPINPAALSVPKPMTTARPTAVR